MQYRCIRARQGTEVGDLVEVPDGAQVSDLYFEPAGQASPPPGGPPGPPVSPVPASTPPPSSGASSAPAEGQPA